MDQRGIARKLTLFCAALTLLLGLGVAQAQNTYTVTTTNDDASAAACSGTAPAFTCATLRDAITDADADGLSDTINSSVSGTITLSSTLPNITGTLTITGAGQNITLSGNNISQVQAFEVGGEAVVAVNSLTIADFNGANNSAITNGGTLTVTNSTFSGNSTDFEGGAIYNGGMLTVTNSTFSGNSTAGELEGGGAIFNEGTLTVTNSTFSGNSTGHEGGAIYSSFYGPLTVTDSTFSGNYATGEFGEGGAMFLAPYSGDTYVVMNSTFSGNTASAGQGGGIYLLEGALTVADSTFAGNSASTGGGGAVYNATYDSAILTLTNTILASSPTGGNCGAYGSPEVTDGGGNLSDDASCSFSPSSNNSVTTLDLGTLANNGGPTQTIALNSGSTAIGFDTANCPATDQRGVTRPSATQCDAGAFQTGTAAIGLVKSANLASYSAPGTLVTYMYTVTNTGPIPLSQFIVSDPMPNLSAVSCPSGSLAPAPASASSVTCTATYTTTTTDVTNGAITNTGTATGTPFGTPPVGPNVTATSPVTISAEQTASIAIVLSAMPANFSAPGTVITYSYLVTNSGNVDLSSVSVSDSMTGLSAISCPSTTLASAASETCTATYTTVQADVTAGGIANSATASGTTALEALVTSPLSTWTIPATDAPAIGVVKSASIASYSAEGTPVTYSYNVTNTGNETLNPVTVTDPMTGLSAISCPVTFLAPTESETCTATYTTTTADVTNGSIINTGTATGTAETGFQATATSTLTIPYAVVTPCSAGSYSATGDTPCTLAPAGSYVSTTGAMAATPCGLGTYSNVTGSSSCTPAPEGSYVGTTGAMAAAQCGLGTYSNATGSSSCTPAPEGSYVGTTGAMAATPCGLGTYSNVTGSSSCTPAPEGSYVGTIGAMAATPCGLGTYSNVTGSSSCTPAPLGSYVGITGASAATPCLAGTYSNVTGSSSCTLAPAGSYVGITGASAATACAVGSYQPTAGQTSCLLAGTGYYVASSGQTTETTCPAGDTTLATGSTSASACVPISSPIASISPAGINFGTLYLGSIVTKTVTVKNVGNATMTIKAPLIAIVQGGNSDEFITVNLCPASLAAGKSCTMTVTFIAGPFYSPQTATLMINDNAAGSPQTVPLTATVIDPVASFNPTSLSFGTVKANSGTATKSVTLTSAGGTALSVNSIAISGANPADFSQTNTCPASMAPKATCSISVTFKPKAKGSRSGSLVITTNARNSPQSISLSGTGN